MKKILFVFLLVLAGCSANQAVVETQIISRPAVEQRALTSAMESAFKPVEFAKLVPGKSYVEVIGLSDRDLAFVRGYVENRILAAGGQVTRNPQDTDFKINLVLTVIGGDRVSSKFLFFSSDRFDGEFAGRWTVIDANDNVLMSERLSATSSEVIR